MTPYLNLRTLDNGSYELEATPDLYMRPDNEALLVIPFEPIWTEEGNERIRGYAARLSQRDAVSVVLYWCDEHPDKLGDDPVFEVFRGGQLHAVATTFLADWEYRLNLWRAGDTDPWQTWMPGEEPVAKPKPKVCTCSGCELHHPEVVF